MSYMSRGNKEITMQSSLSHNHRPVENHIIPHEKPRILDRNSGGSESKQASNPRISYRECLRNHAANIGGNVTDGCGEFMPSGEEGTLEALNCAACNCHRNFHRKDITAAATPGVYPLQLTPPPAAKLAFGGGGCGIVGTDSSSEEMNFNAYQYSNPVAPLPPPRFAAKKRHRTKFTSEQKEKMLGFAEKLGWRIPREDDSEVQRFCAEVGVKRQVFKVWMHNNKGSSSKQNPQEF